jgi:predicted DNA-binding transcriptional regulator AlpA
MLGGIGMQKPKRARSRKIQTAPKPKRSPPPKIEPVPRLAFSIAEFCEASGLSQATYFKMKNQGLGPIEMKIGRRVLITPQAVSNWQRQRETTNTAG